jgi:hypothetical protein
VRSLALAFAAVLTSGGKHFGQWLATVCGFVCWDFSYVQARQEDARAPAGRHCGRMTDPFLPRMISWIDQTRGQIRGDVIHGKLLALGFTACIS